MYPRRLWCIQTCRFLNNQRNQSQTISIVFSLQLQCSGNSKNLNWKRIVKLSKSLFLAGIFLVNWPMNTII